MATDIATLALKADSTEIKKADADLDGLAKSADHAGVEVDQLSGRMIKGGKSAKTYSANVANASKTNGRLVNSAQNASYQVADLAVQLEGGTSFARAFGQQGSQLLAAFGPYGAIAGAAVAVTAALSSSFFGASESAAELAEEIDGLVDSYKDLDGRQKEVQRIALKDKLHEESIARSELREEIEEQTEAVRLAEEAEQKKLNSALLANKSDVRRANATVRLRNAANDEREALAVLEGQMANSELKTREYTVALSKLNGTYDAQVSGIDKAAAAELELVDADIKALEVAERNEKAVQGLVQTLRNQEETYGQTAAQALVYRLALAEGVTPAILEEAEALQKSIDAKIAKTKADKDAAAEARRAAAEQGRIDTQAQDILFDLQTEEDQIRQSYERRAQIVRDATLKEGQDRAAILEQLEIDKDAKLQELENERITKKLELNEALFGGLAGMAKGLVGEQSSAYKALFAIEKGFAIAKAAINIPEAYSEAYSAVVGIPVVGPALAPAAGAAAAAAQVAQVANIKSTTASFDGGGFTGFGSRTGGLDGKGGFGAILHPNETVIDHTRGQSMGGVNVQVINYGGDNVQTSQDGNNLKIIIGQVKQSISNDISRGVGPVTKSLQGTFGLTRQGNR